MEITKLFSGFVDAVNLDNLLIDWSQFIPDLLASFLGALFGFLLALLLEDAIQQRSVTKERREIENRHIFVLKLLTAEIMRNLERLQRMKSELRTTKTIDYSVTLETWQATRQDVLKAIRDPEIASTITQLYDYLNLVGGSLNVYNRLILDNKGGLYEAKVERLQNLENLIDRAIDLENKAKCGLDVEITRV